jgi:hypothetical protein
MSQDTTGRKPQQGTTFSRSTDGNSYTQLTGITTIASPVRDRDGSDNTPVDADHEKQDPAFFKKATQVKIAGFMQETQATTLLGDYTGKTDPLYWKEQLLPTGAESTGPTVTYQGWVQSVDLGKKEHKSTDKVMVEFQINVDPSTIAYNAGS